MYGRTRRIHFVGIGGVGMSGIAEVLLNLGYQVSGSDLRTGEATERLAALGGRILQGHEAANVEGAQVVVFSTAVRPDNPEVVAARAQGIPVIPRAEMLAELMRMKYGVAVAGSHGKTTTTSLTAAVLARGGLDPTIVVGGRLQSIGSNARLGRGQFLVAEADESDGSFLRLSPAVAVVTNVDREHLDHYGSLEELRQAFVYFANRVPFYGVSILCGDDPQVRGILPQLTKRHLLYGTGPEATLRAVDVRPGPEGSTFRVVTDGRDLGEVRLRLPGTHSVLNALAAVAVGLELEVAFPHIAGALEDFPGVGRRFETRGEAGGVLVVDDYGHHPSEIAAVLRAAKEHGRRRVVALFQPHRYTRTRDLLPDFAGAFGDADLVFIAPLYPAGEDPIEGVSAKSVADAITAAGHPACRLVGDLAEMPAAVRPHLTTRDVVITLGAGNITRVGDALLAQLADHGVGVVA